MLSVSFSYRGINPVAYIIVFGSTGQFIAFQHRALTQHFVGINLVSPSVPIRHFTFRQCQEVARQVDPYEPKSDRIPMTKGNELIQVLGMRVPDFQG